MASAGTLYINIAARTEKLTKGLDSASSKLRRFAGKAALGGVTAAAGAATAAGVLATRTFREMAPVIDKVGKAADRLGTSTQALSALSHAAKLSGSSFDQLANGLTFMQRNLAEAMQGTGPAADALGMLGLSARELAGMNADDAFAKIADEISRLPSAAQKTQVAMDLFGRSGANLLPLMKDGAKGIREMMADADRLGVTFTGAQSKMVQAANDALTRWQAAGDGIKTQFTIAIAPAVEMAANKMADWVASMNAAGSAGAKFTGGLKMLGTAIGVVADVAHLVKVAFYGLQTTVTAVFTVIAKIVAGAVAAAIKALNHLPGVNLQNPQILNVLADDLERKTNELGRKTADTFMGPMPSEKIDKFFRDMEMAADQAAKVIEPKMKNALLPPALHSAFQNIGASLGGLNNTLPAAAKKAAGVLAGIGSGQSTGQTPALALARTGSAESYRNRVAFSKQKETVKIAKDQLSTQKGIKAGIDKLVAKFPTFSPANLFGG